MSTFATLEDLPDGQRVLLRLDLNSPLQDGEIQDNPRFASHARTVRELVDRDCGVAVLAHQGRPGRESFVSLEQHASILAEHVGTPVDFVPETFGEGAVDAVRTLEGGEILLLENSRMCDAELPEEPPDVKADSEFVQTLAPEFDAFVNDAYSAAHRSHASLVGFPLVMPAYAGRVMEAEYEANTAIASREFDGSVTMVIGGMKATDVIDVMEALMDDVDDFLLGGIAGELFLRADGYPVGMDVGDHELFDHQWQENRETIEQMLAHNREKITLPVDRAYADEHGGRAETTVADVEEKTYNYPDVGVVTVDEYAPVIDDSAAVFVKGALGKFEDERFADGTVGVLEAIAESDCFSVVGGGDTSRAIDLYGLDSADFSHVSIAGGAYIRALTSGELAGVDVLQSGP
jgi:phosphoglycerate kinase